MSGPSPENLKNIFSMLPDLASGSVEESAAARTKLCVICGSTHRETIKHDGETQGVATCRNCLQLLEEGFTALVSPDNRYAFLKVAAMADKAGQCLQVEPHTMDLVEQRVSNDGGSRE